MHPDLREYLPWHLNQHKHKEHSIYSYLGLEAILVELLFPLFLRLMVMLVELLFLLSLRLMVMLVEPLFLLSLGLTAVESM